MQNTDTPTPPIRLEKPLRINRSAMMMLLVVFIDLLGFEVVLPLLPRIALKSYIELVYPEPAWMVRIDQACWSSSFR